MVDLGIALFFVVGAGFIVYLALDAVRRAD